MGKRNKKFEISKEFIEDRIGEFLKYIEENEASLFAYFMMTGKIEQQFRDRFAFWLQNWFQENCVDPYVVTRETTISEKPTKKSKKTTKKADEKTADIAIFRFGETKPVAVIEFKASCLFDVVKGKNKKTFVDFLEKLKKDVERWDRINSLGIMLVQDLGNIKKLEKLVNTKENCLTKYNINENCLATYIKYFKDFWKYKECREEINKLLNGKKKNDELKFLKELLESGELKFLEKPLETTYKLSKKVILKFHLKVGILKNECYE